MTEELEAEIVAGQTYEMSSLFSAPGVPPTRVIAESNRGGGMWRVRRANGLDLLTFANHLTGPGDRIYTGMNTWTSRDVIAWSWHNDGEVDHLQFVSGWSHNRDVPLIANHSGEGSNYGRMIWPRVLNRVHRDYPNADFRVLRIRNTRANIYEDGYPPRPTQFW